MVNDEQKIAETLPEPADGEVLVVKNGDTDWRVIWRDDKAAKRWHDDADPMGLYQHVKYAEAVYALGQRVAVAGSELVPAA